MLLQTKITPQEAIYYGAIAGTVLGFLLGLAVLILGIKKKKRKLGIIGCIASILVGPISGLLSVIVAGIFIYLILKKSPPAESADVETVDENSIDVKTDDLENR